MISSMSRDLNSRSANHSIGNIYSSQQHSAATMYEHPPEMTGTNTSINSPAPYSQNYQNNDSNANNNNFYLGNYHQPDHLSETGPPGFSNISMSVSGNSFPPNVTPSHIYQYSQYSNNSSMAPNYGFLNGRTVRSNSPGNEMGPINDNSNINNNRYYGYPQEARAVSSPLVDDASVKPANQTNNTPLGYFFNGPNGLILQNSPQVINSSSSGSEDMLFNSPRNSSVSSSTTTAGSAYGNYEKSSSTPPFALYNASPLSATSNFSSSTASSLTKSGKVNKQGKTKRSRMGCLTCRGRKKRCCERKPTCLECERLGLKCNWPTPGMENRNRSKNNKFIEDRNVVDTPYGKIKVLRGVVSNKD